MLHKNFTFKSDEGTEIYVYVWMPDKKVDLKGIVQIAHGMAETGARYERFAKKLTDNGYIVYINDHRGHGKTAKTVENVGYLGEAEGFKWLVEDLHKLSEIIHKKMGISVSYKLYKDGRHEMLNETNREEVMKDVIDWLDHHFV